MLKIKKTYQLKDGAKDQIIEFIRNTGDEEEYMLFFPGTEQAARAYVHTMRVELSRLRQLVKNRGKSIRPFKVLLERLQPVCLNDINGYIIILARRNKHVAAHDDINNIMDELSSGDMIKKKETVDE